MFKWIRATFEVAGAVSVLLSLGAGVIVGALAAWFSGLPLGYQIVLGVGVGLIVAGFLLALVRYIKQRRKPPPPARPEPKRIGYLGREGSTGNLPDAEFYDTLDTGIDSEGDVEAPRAKFGKRDEDDDDAT